ncbi:MAG: Hpt domain-containing protein, partial [Desulfamplus sp.]|nr:Hpt domain-containing protein [Desulfamplus sp.]
MDFKKMASEIGIEEEDFIELAEMLVDVSLNDLANFEEGIESGNLKNAAMSAHSIKGASANLGFKDVTSAAAELEKSAKSEELSQIEKYITIIK